MSQLFIMTIGFSNSGKSSLVEKILSRFPEKFNHVDTNHIHNFLNTTYPAFKDDNTVAGEAYELRKEATESIHNTLLRVLIEANVNVILGSSNLKKVERHGIFERVRRAKSNIKTMIIWVKISEEDLLQKITEMDKGLEEAGIKPVWVDLYNKVQKPRFDSPAKEEADYFIEYQEGREGEVEAVLDLIKSGLES